MSLLQQESSGVQDNSRPGESYTKGTSHLVIATIISAIVVSVAVAFYVIAAEKPPAATAEILEVWAHPMHSETAGWDANGAEIPKESIDQVLVFTRARVHNQSPQRIFLHQITTDIALADGLHSSFAAMPTDYERLFRAYPALAQWHTATLSPETTIEAGQTAEGTFVSSFRIPKAEWDARKSLSFTFAFQYLPSLTVESKVAVTEH